MKGDKFSVKQDALWNPHTHKKIFIKSFFFFFLEYRIQEAAHQRQTVPSSSKLWRTGERTLCAGFAHSFVANGGPRTIKKGPSWRFGTTFLWATRRRSRERESWLGRPRAASHSLQGLFALITLQPSKVIVNYTCLWCSYLSLPLSLLFVFHFFIFSPLFSTSLKTLGSFPARYLHPLTCFTISWIWDEVNVTRTFKQQFTAIGKKIKIIKIWTINKRNEKRGGVNHGQDGFGE